jgi:NitT/TauT family transport system ATP-binding protein
LLLHKGGSLIHYPDFMFQYREAANFPWVSQAQWLYSQMLRWDHAPYSAEDEAKVQRVFRPDIYRSALTGTDAPFPALRRK